MYCDILKRDLKRKKTMNAILLIFNILVSMFISSSIHNLLSISAAMENYIARSELPDYYIFGYDTPDAQITMEKILSKYDVSAVKTNLMPCFDNSNLLRSDGGKVDFSYSIGIGSPTASATKIFDKNNIEITEIQDGDLYLAPYFMSYCGFSVGDQIKFQNNGYQKEFIIRGTCKDILYSTATAGMSRFMVSENDYQDIRDHSGLPLYRYYGIYTGQTQAIAEEISTAGLQISFSTDQDTVETMYILDMVLAGIMLTVSIFLILISLVILRFTITFTLSEEFREIGVMKAIGIRNHQIRWLYCIKYFAVSAVGSLLGLFFSIPFGSLLLSQASVNILIDGSTGYLVNIIGSISVVFLITAFCFFTTGKLRKYSPLDAIRNGSNGERYKGKNLIRLGRSFLPPVAFLSVNDISSNVKRFGTLIITFTIGIILILIPVNTANTLQSDHLVTWFSMAESDVYIVTGGLFSTANTSRSDLESTLSGFQEKLAQNNIPAEAFQEYMFKFSVAYQDKSTSSLAFQGINVTTDQYSYLEGTAPQNNNEVAVSHIIAKRLGAAIGDTISITMGENSVDFMISSIYQTMNNLGEGVRFYHDYPLDYRYSIGSFATQLRYTDDPSEEQKKERIKIIRELYPDYPVYTGGEYVNVMIGADIGDMVQFIILIVLAINALVAVLVVKSFITKEKGEIAMLKAIGFRNSALICWQTCRIGLIMIFSVVLGTLLSGPLSQISVVTIFKSLGASNLDLAVRPLQVYVLYPLLMLSSSMFVSFLSALQIRRIAASETQNIE